MRRLAMLLLATALLMPSAAQAAGTSDIIAETARNYHGKAHIVNFWWLPMQYWASAARALGKTEVEINQVRALYANYTMLAVVDVKIAPDGAMDALSIAEIVRRLDIYVNGTPFEVLHQVDVKLQEMSPELTYVLRTSLAEVGRGLRLLPLANLGADGKPILRATSDGVLRLTYRATPGEDPIEFWWHSPLTSIVGGNKCKGTGAPMEASWTHCPWGGAPVE